MRLPQFNELAQSKEMLEEFGGYNHNLRINNGEWYDQKNMCTDYYPAASSRGRRYKTAELGERQIYPLSLGLSVKNPHDSAYGNWRLTPSNSVDAIYSLQDLYEGTSKVGKWFCGFYNQPITYSGITAAEIKEKGALFDTSKKSSLVSMGSYICTLPDGVVFETAKSFAELPLYKVQESIVFESGTKAVSVIKRGSESFPYYTFTVEQINQRSLDDGTIRFNREDKLLQRYIADDAIWVNQPTCVVVLKNNTTGTFGNLKVGDVISIVNADMASGYTDYSDYVDKTVKIIDKGTLASGKTFAGTTLSADTDYIVFEGLALELYNVTYGTSIDLTSCERKMPVVSNIACESQNRLWCCDKNGHEIYASALGNPYNFYDYSGLATDSYAVNVGTAGKWTGCINYNGTPMFFKETALHIINGSYPTNQGQLDGGSYSVTTYTNFKGVASGSEESMVIIDGILYYHSRDGIVAFDGANTTVISNALGNKRFYYAVAGTDGRKYYVSMSDKESNPQNWHLFVYDTKTGLWSREDSTRIIDSYTTERGLMCFVSSAKDWLYIENAENTIETTGSTNTNWEATGDIDWMCESGVYGYSYPNNKYVSRFQIRLQIAAGATASVYIQYDSDGVWHKKGEFSNKGTKTYLLPIVPQRCDHMKLKFEGKGDVKIISIAKILEEGGDV